MNNTNRQWQLASRPKDMVNETNFRLVETSIPEPTKGEIVMKSSYLTVAPYMRGRMRDRKSYAESVKIGEVVTGQAVGTVLASRSDHFQPGDPVLTPLAGRNTESHQQTRRAASIHLRRPSPPHSMYWTCPA
ncbi:MAG: NADPH-dependent curcumin reductase [Verrucomicrobia subdivision 3 bacterium]|nr:NADPH-dependent curcumin reductase [Limisphaerales bacterium]MCS1413915.1 NADPH-dependent curcumin reductase [Limisphaerales bacterium]